MFAKCLSSATFSHSSQPKLLLISAFVSVLAACSSGGDDSSAGAGNENEEPTVEGEMAIDMEAGTVGTEPEPVVMSDPFIDPNDVVPEPADGSIADTLLFRSDFSILLQLIEDADLATALQGDNNGLGWTLFAPSDSEFNNDPAFSSMTDEERAQLLRLHVFPGTLLLADFVAGSLNMQEGSALVELDEQGVVTVGAARIVARDRQFNNGVIHFVNAVLQPEQ